MAGPFEGHASSVVSVAFSPYGDEIVSGSEDATILVWDVEGEQTLFAPFEGHRSLIWSVAFSPDGKRVVSGSRDHTIRVWNVEDSISDWILGKDGWIH